MGKLDRAVCYLSGPMEFVADHGVIWRRKFVKMAVKAGLKLDFIDPTDKPGGVSMQIGERKEYQESLQKNGLFEELRDYVHRYRHIDLRFTDLADLLVALVDPSVPQWGTSDEIYTAERQHKPTFIICEGGLYKLPRWLFDVVPLDHVFDSLGGVIEKLISLDRGEEELGEDWVLVRKFIEDSRTTRCLAEEQLT